MSEEKKKRGSQDWAGIGDLLPSDEDRRMPMFEPRKYEKAMEYEKSANPRLRRHATAYLDTQWTIYELWEYEQKLKELGVRDIKKAKQAQRMLSELVKRNLRGR